MPITAFKDTEKNLEVSLEGGAEYFDAAGIMPAAAVTAIRADEERQHTLPVVNPSFAYPGHNCRRELLLKKYTPYVMDPRSRWAAMEGGFWHKFLAALQAPGYHAETYLPDQTGADDDHPGVRVIDAPWGLPIRQLEVFPGWWARIRLDLASPDWKKIIDYKTTKYPYTYKYKGEPSLTYENKDATQVWPIQLSLEAMFVEALRDVLVEELWVWRMYRGSHRNDKTWRKVPIKRLQPEQLWRVIGEHVSTTQEWLIEAETASDPLAVAKEAPADGLRLNMFNGWKCREGCPVSEACGRLEGLMEW